MVPQSPADFKTERKISMNLEKIAAVTTGNYSLLYKELIELMGIAENDAFTAIRLTYKYGFMRGKNAAKASSRKRAVKK